MAGKGTAAVVVFRRLSMAPEVVCFQTRVPRRSHDWTATADNAFEVAAGR